MYGKTIIPAKIRPLCDQLAGAFKDRGFLTAKLKEFKDSGGNVVGEVDVAVLDRDTRQLDLIEVKWLIPPDSPHEEFQANEQIYEVGRSQLTALVNLCHDAPESFIEELFGESVGNRAADITVGSYLVTRGFLGFTPLADRPFVLDFDELIGVVRVQDGSLDSIWAKAVEVLRSLAPAETQFVSRDTPIGGYVLRAPAFYDGPSVIGTPPAATADVKKIGWNQSCSCGSALKFKKCCIELV